MEFETVMALSLGPVVMISGVGLLLLSMTNRLGRVVDRSRILSREIQSAVPGSASRRALRYQLGVLWKRCGILTSAIACEAVCLILVGVLMMVLFAEAILGITPGLLPSALFALSIVALIAGMVFFLADITLTLKALRAEVRQGLRARSDGGKSEG